jgi:hypothetical protein
MQIFVRRADGALDVCPVPNLSTDVAQLFRQGSCAEGTTTLTIRDDQGRKAQVFIDPSGLARRDY